MANINYLIRLYKQVMAVRRSGDLFWSLERAKLLEKGQTYETLHTFNTFIQNMGGIEN